MYTCAGLIIYKSNFILLNISYQNEHLECGQNGAATAIPTALQRAGVIPNLSSLAKASSWDDTMCLTQLPEVVNTTISQECIANE